MELEFRVTICLGHGGDMAATLDITDTEYELLNRML